MAYWSVDIKDSVAMLTFTAPRNHLSLAAMTELADALDDLAARRDEVTVVGLAGGDDGYFIADVDRDELVELAAGEAVEGDPGAWHRAMSALESMPQPTVAAIDGHVRGGGCATALACTLRIGSGRADVGHFEVNLGIVGADSAERLTRLVGPAIGAELLLTDRILEADEARRIGLLNDVLPAEAFPDHVHDWCKRITRNPPAAVFDAKRAVVDGLCVNRDDVLTIEHALGSLTGGIANRPLPEP